jgi:hypothetical protein
MTNCPPRDKGAENLLTAATGSSITVESLSTKLKHMTTPTVTQNGALYLAQHEASRRRATLFQKLRSMVRNGIVQVNSGLSNLLSSPRRPREGGSHKSLF